MAITPYDRWLAGLETNLAQLEHSGRRRRLAAVNSSQGPEIVLAGRTVLQFCNNDYLGLSSHPAVKEAARRAIDRFGFGAGASRLVAGSMELHHALERRLAALKRTPQALVFSSGYLANIAALTTFAGPDAAIVSDKLNHASLLDAARFSGAWHRTFPHRNVARAQALLARFRAATATTVPDEGAAPALVPAPARNRRNAFCVTDSVFSMDGDLADLAALCAMAQQQEALVVIDEAHATGIFGANGAGLAEEQGVENQIAISIGTLSKALGSIGGFVAGAAPVIETLINNARSFIFTTALPPAASAAALAALDLIAADAQPRQRLRAAAGYVAAEIAGLGYVCGAGLAPIIPVIFGASETALAASRALLEQGIYVPAIRPPTVARGSARLRITLSAAHTDAQIECLLTALRRLREKMQRC